MTVNEDKETKPEATTDAPQKQNPLEQIGNVINNHAASINDTKNAINSLAVDVKTNTGGMDIFSKRFDLIERQLDGIDKYINRLENRLNEK